MKVSDEMLTAGFSDAIRMIPKADWLEGRSVNEMCHIWNKACVLAGRPELQAPLEAVIGLEALPTFGFREGLIIGKQLKEQKHSK